MEIVAVLSVVWTAMGWRGYKLADYWRHTWPKLVTLSIVYGLLAISLEPDLVAIALVPPIWFLITAIISLLAFWVGGTARALAGRPG